MHLILDAERGATMAYLDKVVQEQGGRRGRAQVRTPTDGMTSAASRHATNRAGDPPGPRPHPGGKYREDGRRTRRLEGARHRAAPGPSPCRHRGGPDGGGGQKRWSLVTASRPTPGLRADWGLGRRRHPKKKPGEVLATRAAQIEAAVGPDASYGPGALPRGPPGTAKAASGLRSWSPSGGTSWPRRGTRRWSWRPRASALTWSIGRPSEALSTRSPPSSCPPAAAWRKKRPSPGATSSWLSPRTCIGLPVQRFETAVDRVLSHQLAVPLPAVAGAREPAWSAAFVLEDERRIASWPHAHPKGGAALTIAQQFRPSGKWICPEVCVSPRDRLRWPSPCLFPATPLTWSSGWPGRGRRAHCRRCEKVLRRRATKWSARPPPARRPRPSVKARRSLPDGGVAHLAPGARAEALTPRHVLVLDEGAMSSDADVGKLLAAVQASGAVAVLAARRPLRSSRQAWSASQCSARSYDQPFSSCRVK